MHFCEPRTVSHGYPQVGKYGPGQPADFSGERCTRSVSESLERLGMDYIDVILIHDVEYIDDLQKARASALLTMHRAFVGHA